MAGLVKIIDAPEAGSKLQQPELRYLAIGRVVRAHGIQGEISVTVLTDFPERFDNTEWLYLGNEFEADAYRLTKYRWHKDNILLSLAGITSRTQAEQLKDLLVQVPIAEAMALPDNGVYLYQLIGLKVITTDQEVLGTITEIIETKANDVYVVETADKKQLLIPAISDVIKAVDLKRKQVVVHLLDGLI